MYGEWTTTTISPVVLPNVTDDEQQTLNDAAVSAVGVQAGPQPAARLLLRRPSGDRSGRDDHPAVSTRSWRSFGVVGESRGHPGGSLQPGWVRVA
jgi:hypothetical protein